MARAAVPGPAWSGARAQPTLMADVRDMRGGDLLAEIGIGLPTQETP